MARLDPTKPPIEMLADFGPDCAGVSQSEARAYAVAFARRASENFVVLGRLLPPDLVEDFAAVYAFCRWADDLGDERDPLIRADAPAEMVRARALELLGWFRHELDRDDPSHPVLVALRPTIEKHRLPKAEFGHLISAFEMDQRVLCYQTWRQLLGYCELSANPVGRLVLMLAGLRPPEEEPSNADAWRKSDAICTALQLTNHLQDVRQDLIERDRVYLPKEDTGFDVEQLRAWSQTAEDSAARIRYIKALRPLVDRTNELYQQGAGLPSLVEGRLGSLIGMMAMGGRATLHKIDREGCTTLWKRPRVGAATRAWIALRGFASLYSPTWRNTSTNSNASRH